MSELEEKTISSKKIYSGKIISLYNDSVLCPNGNKAEREYVHHPGGAAMLGITKDNKIVLERQFRYPYRKDIYEIPAGKINEGEDPKLAAIREFEEETGYIARDVFHLGSIYPTVGYSDEVIYLYASNNLEKGTTNLDEDEIVELNYFTIDEIEQMIISGEIPDGKTILAISLYKLKNKK